MTTGDLFCQAAKRCFVEKPFAFNVVDILHITYNSNRIGGNKAERVEQVQHPNGMRRGCGERIDYRRARWMQVVPGQFGLKLQCT